MLAQKLLTLSLITSVSGFVVFNPIYARKMTHSLLVTQQPVIDVETIAKKIAVKVHVDDNRASGVLVARDNNIYTVITNAHVVDRGETYTIETTDGIEHQATLVVKDGAITGNDLAILEFSSSNQYQTAKLGETKDANQGDTVIAAGFPFDRNNILITEGKITLIPDKPLKKGYQIGFTNQTIQGMSGGMLLNSQGEVIGILGKGKDALLDTAYDYQDGTKPNEEEIALMRNASFSIPIGNILELSPKLANLFPSKDNSSLALAIINNLLGTTSFSNTITQVPEYKSGYTGIVKTVDDIAQQITVRIDFIDHQGTKQNGSGVILAKQNNTYYIATAKHVVKTEQQYKIITPDGATHQLDNKTIILSQAYDLAIFSVESENQYQVATVGNYTVAANDDQVVFLSGFPNFKENTSLKRMITGGKVRQQEKTQFSTKDNYSFALSTPQAQGLLYSNLSYHGMSGGAVLDTQGRLVGINTHAENDIYFDESKDYQPNESYEINLGLSLGIPIQDILGFLITQTHLKTRWLQESKNPAREISDNDWQSVENQLFRAKQPDNDTDLVAWMNYGNQLWRYGKFNEAIKAFEQVIKINPQFKQAYYAMGLAYLYQANYQQAAEVLSKAIEINPSSYYYWRWLGYSYKKLKQYEQAVAAYDKAIEKNAEDFVLYQELGDILGESEQYQEALEQYNRAISLNPKHPWIYNNRGVTYAKLKQYDNAIADYTKAISINPQDADAYNNRGTIYFYLKQYNNALANYTKAISINPQDADAYNNRGTTCFYLKQYDNALANYTQAISINPQDAQAYYNRGIVYDDLKQYDNALADYTQAISINPQLAQGYNNRGSTYHELKQYEQAIVDFTKAILINPQDADTYYNRAVTYFYFKQYDKAIADYTQVSLINPQYADVYNNRGVTHHQLKQYEQAIADYTEAISINSQYADVYNNRGVTYHQLKQYDKAITDYTEAISINPQYAHAYNNRGVTYHQLKQYDKAITDYRKLLLIDRKNILATTNIGLIRYETDTPTAAKQQFQQALAIDNQSVEMQLAVAVTEYISGNRETALQLAKAALEIDARFADTEFLRENLWGDKLIADTEKLLGELSINLDP